MTFISLEDIQNKTANIYEAVVVMAKRARQINDDQKMQIQNEMDVSVPIDMRESEDFDDVEIDREALLREYKKFPKPSTLAIQEMAEGKIEYRIISDEDDEAGS